MHIKITFLSIVINLTFLTISNAKLLVEEHFDSYSPSEIAGTAAKGKGLTGAWAAEVSAEVVSEEIFEGGGNSLLVKPNGKWTYIRFEDESLIGENSGDKLYISFQIMMKSTSSSRAQALVSFIENSNNFSEAINVGQLWNKKNFGLSNSPQSSDELDLKPHTFLLVITRQKGTSLQSQLYLDPIDVNRLPLSAQKPGATGWPKLENIQGMGFKSSGNAFLVDSIRIGTTLEDVLVNP